MDALQAEHDQVWKKSQLRKTADHAQEVIDALQSARNAIASGTHEPNAPNVGSIVTNVLQIPTRLRSP